MQPKSFEPIVSLEMVERARQRLSSRFYSDEQLLLAIVREHVQTNGRIGGRDMKPSNGLPFMETFRKRFGSLWRVYELAGIRSDDERMWQYAGARGRFVCSRLSQEFRSAIVESRHPFTVCKKVYSLQGCRPVRFQMARCLQTRRGDLRWCIRVSKGSPGQAWAVARLKLGNNEVLDWFLLL